MDTEEKRASNDEGRIGKREQRSFLADIARQVDESDIVPLVGRSGDQSLGGIPTSVVDEKNVERHVGFDPRQTLGWLAARTAIREWPPVRCVFSLRRLSPPRRRAPWIGSRGSRGRPLHLLRSPRPEPADA